MPEGSPWTSLHLEMCPPKIPGFCKYMPVNSYLSFQFQFMSATGAPIVHCPTVPKLSTLIPCSTSVPCLGFCVSCWPPSVSFAPIISPKQVQLLTVPPYLLDISLMNPDQTLPDSFQFLLFHLFPLGLLRVVLQLMSHPLVLGVSQQCKRCPSFIAWKSGHFVLLVPEVNVF